MIPVEDRWRRTLRWPVFGTIGLATVFFLYVVPVKETPWLFDHAPWFNDPFDVVISFMMLFVPLVAALCVPRILLCRRSEPLPVVRIVDVLRGCRLIVTCVSFTLASEWTALAMRENRRAWNAATWLQVGMLAIMSCLTLAVVVALRAAGNRQLNTSRSSDDAPDWLADSLAWLKVQSRLVGPAQRPMVRALTYVNDTVFSVVRRHPLWSALGACTLFGFAGGINQGIREGYPPSITVLASGLLAFGMFGLVASSGHYLGLVHSSAPSRGSQRRRIDAAVVTCVGVLVPFAFRYHLWWMVGSTNAVAGAAQITELVALSAVVIFTLALGIETALRTHSTAF
jgi:hypothetical protein